MAPSRVCLVLLFLTAVQTGHGGGQSCVDKQQVVGVLRQMERFLKGQELRFNEAFRIMKSKMALLHNSVSKLPQADQSAAPSICPPLEDPVNGRKFGSKYLEGHEVHFTCSHGYHLVGTGTRVCQENSSWSGANAICTDVNECSSAPCLNGGTCVDWRAQYRCTCPQNWSGSRCQHQTQTVVPRHSQAHRMKAKLPLLSRPALPEWSVMDDPAFSRRPRCTKVDRAQHCSCDAGFHMSGTSDSSICQDVNECEVFRLDQGGKLCAHACVNVPGSYQCSCPRGYKLLSDSRSCEDVDECLSQQHNCSRGTTCINTGGGFQCVNPECPHSHGNVSYIKTSPFQCERNPCPMESRSCHLAPKTISFHFLPLPSTLQTPATLFRMATAAPPSPPSPGRSGPDSLRFGIVGGNPRGLFVMQRSDRQTGELILVQPIRGPQEVSVEVDMAEYSDRVFQAKHLARVTLLVSPYNF
ncbi:fibulin-7 isoform X2 [Hypomesus transpacificus]|uniref:fibulin-7 isoform X2 n=1 Tax=Hypomesus transpacificus TaxID=137520 RepID=UPI001F08842D|nr:fibulin-7 isoform X2 [Hypomesus transpacificus]